MREYRLRTLVDSVIVSDPANLTYQTQNMWKVAESWQFSNKSRIFSFSDGLKSGLLMVMLSTLSSVYLTGYLWPAVP